MMRPDQRSPEAAAYRKLYNTAQWRALRKAQLQAQPLCERCKAKGFLVAATVVNHRKPHKGDQRLFFDPTGLESTCKPCHDGPIQSEEATGKPCHDGPIQSEEATGKAKRRVGYSNAVGPDGLPTDPRHPFNAG
jgi:5-methylcytosine-specific restriction protein A